MTGHCNRRARPPRRALRTAPAPIEGKALRRAVGPGLATRLEQHLSSQARSYAFATRATLEAPAPRNTESLFPVCPGYRPVMTHTTHQPNAKVQPGDGATGVLVVLGTAPTDEAAGLARKLVQEELVACVNLVPAVRSIYRWRGQIEDDTETLLVMKTTVEGFQRLERRYSELHSYDVPELLALSVAAGHPAYLEWLLSEPGPPTPDAQ